MVSIVIDFFVDLFFFLFPLYFVSRETGVHPKKFSDLKPALERLGFKRILVWEMAKQTLLLFVVLSVIGVALSLLLSVAGANDLEQVSRGVETMARVSPFLLAYFLVVRVFTEEVFFRGFLVNKLGVFPSTILFALAHALYNSFAEVLGAFALGLVLAISFKKRQCLFPMIAGHLLYNVFALVFILRVV